MVNSMENAAIKEGMWIDTSSGPILVGNKCDSCGELLFPKKKNNFCPNCHKSTLKEVELSNDGIIKSFTIVNRRPAGGYYKGSVPYCYGLVTLPEGINILTLFEDAEWGKMEFGQKAKLIVEKLYDEDDKAIYTYKFSPIFSDTI